MWFAIVLCLRKILSYLDLHLLCNFQVSRSKQVTRRNGILPYKCYGKIAVVDAQQLTRYCCELIFCIFVTSFGLDGFVTYSILFQVCTEFIKKADASRFNIDRGMHKCIKPESWTTIVGCLHFWHRTVHVYHVCMYVFFLSAEFEEQMTKQLEEMHPENNKSSKNTMQSFFNEFSVINFPCMSFFFLSPADRQKIIEKKKTLFCLPPLFFCLKLLHSLPLNLVNNNQVPFIVVLLFWHDFSFCTIDFHYFY